MTPSRTAPALLRARPTRRTVLATGLATAGVAAGIAGRERAGHAAETGGGEGLRVLGRTGVRLPAVGITLTAPDRGPDVQRAYLRKVVEAFREGGGRAIDASRLSGTAEAALSDVLRDSGDLFVMQALRAAGGDDLAESRALSQVRSSAARLRRDRIDVLQVADLDDAEVAVPMLARWKKAGSIGYVGVGHSDARYLPAIEILMRNAAVDVVHVNYSVLTRVAEEHVLPLAAQRGIGVVASTPAEQELYRIVAGRRVPGWAADFGATTWAQFFLKYVLGHPAVTVALFAAGSPAQVVRTMQALRGPLPDEEQRARMVDHLATLG